MKIVKTVDEVRVIERRSYSRSCSYYGIFARRT